MSNLCTDEVAFNRFRPHGRISITSIEDGIVVYSAAGPFNCELLDAVEVMETDILKEVKETTGDWIEVVVFNGSCMASNEFMDKLTAYLERMKCRSLAPIASVYIFSSKVEGASFMKPKYERSYTAAGIEFNAFATKEEGIAWSESYKEIHHG